MDAIYTVCTYNHLARAFSLAHSVRQHCPDAHFIIGLIGEVGTDTHIPFEYELITAGEMALSFLDEMCSKYSALELNSALKPYFANFILESNKKIDRLTYLDSDILLFENLTPVYKSLESHSIVLTPHSCSTVINGSDFDDRIFLRSGIFNAGFFALKNDLWARAFLTWWMGKLKNQCFFDSKRGMFAEQLWLNLVPLYFEKVHILKHLGCNVAYWNIHERNLSQRNGSYFVNDEIPLIFFHFSGASVDCLKTNSVSEHQKRYTFTNRPDLLPVFKLYVDFLQEYSFGTFNQYYTLNSRLKTRSTLIKAIAELYKKGLKKLFYIK